MIVTAIAAVVEKEKKAVAAAKLVISESAVCGCKTRCAEEQLKIRQR